MSNKQVSTAKRGRRPKARKFYDMGPDFRTGGASLYEIGNERKLAMGRLVMGPLPGQRGFPDFPEKPLILVNKKGHRPLRDLEDCRGYWLVSERAKQVFEQIDPEAFAFVRCEVRFVTGEPGPHYWLCDVVRVLDALDEAASRASAFSPDPACEISDLLGWSSLAFKEDVVGSSHAFRMLQWDPVVICDQSVKDTCKAAGLKGIWFRDADDLWGTGKGLRC